MARDIGTVVREICLGLPQTEEFVSHGTPNFRIARGRSFATYCVNSHGDGRIALWLKAADGAQQRLVEEDPDLFFVPPYVGPAGWIGVNLDRGLDWTAVMQLVRDAWKTVASPRRLNELGPPAIVRPPDISIEPATFDPLGCGAGLALLERVRELALALPGSSESTQFGSPVWRIGKRCFAVLHHDREHVRLKTWVGVDAQHLYTGDARFRIPPYIGHKGWISLALEPDEPDWSEVRSLLKQSWRHFAPAKLAKALPD